jgi:hypothetical protein
VEHFLCLVTFLGVFFVKNISPIGKIPLNPLLQRGKILGMVFSFGAEYMPSDNADCSTWNNKVDDSLLDEPRNCSTWNNLCRKFTAGSCFMKKIVKNPLFYWWAN